MNETFLAQRTLENNLRRERLQFQEEKLHADVGNQGTPLKKIKLIVNNGFMKYELSYEGCREREIVSLNKAMEILHLPVLMYLGVRDGRVVTTEVAKSCGLQYRGECKSSKYWGAYIGESLLQLQSWVPTDIRRDTRGIYYARDRRTDGPREWHADVLLWSLAGLTQALWSAAVECVALEDYTPRNEVHQLDKCLSWLDDVQKFCKENPGKAFRIEKDIGERDLHTSCPTSEKKLPKMPFYSPYEYCLQSAAAALIQSRGDTFSAAVVAKATRKFEGVGQLQDILQGEPPLLWSCDKVHGCVKNDPKHNLALLLQICKARGGMFLVQLSIWDGLSTHVVGIDARDGLIWDSCEKHALLMSNENLKYCCGLGDMRGIESIRELKKQERRARSERDGNKGRNRSRKYFN